jgi:glutathione S-transferase
MRRLLHGPNARHMRQAVAVLGELSAAVKAGGGRHLVGGALTYADIAMAVPLKLLNPVGPSYNRCDTSSVCVVSFVVILLWATLRAAHVQPRSFSMHTGR